MGLCTCAVHGSGNNAWRKQWQPKSGLCARIDCEKELVVLLPRKTEIPHHTFRIGDQIVLTYGWTKAVS